MMVGVITQRKHPSGILPKTCGHNDIVFVYFSGEYEKVPPANHQRKYLMNVILS